MNLVEREELWLEGGGIRFVYPDEYVEKLEKQRDELLAEMQKAREEMACANFNSAAERIEHAIERVKGGAA